MKAALRGLLLSRLSIGELRSVMRETIQAKKLAGQEVGALWYLWCDFWCYSLLYFLSYCLFKIDDMITLFWLYAALYYTLCFSPTLSFYPSHPHSILLILPILTGTRCEPWWCGSRYHSRHHHAIRRRRTARCKQSNVKTRVMERRIGVCMCVHEVDLMVRMG